MDWNKLEEGRRRLKEVVNQNKDRRIVKWYLLYLTFLMLVYVTRPQILKIDHKKEVVETREIYSSMISHEVEDEEEEYIQETIDKMKTKLAKEKVVCLAAIHLGIPLRIVLIGEEVYINPKMISQGKKISKGYESSLFFPMREAKMMVRYLPIQIRTKKGEETMMGWKGHCMINLMDQMDGKTIY